MSSTLPIPIPISSRPTNTKVAAAPPSPLLSSPFKKQKMSITQTYFLAHKARGKLSAEAGRPDHNLRLLVGHANLLDSLMLELAEAERQQESWFNQSVRGAQQQQQKSRHVQWADAVVEEPEHDWDAEDAESDSSSDSESETDEDEDEDEDEDYEMADAVPLRRVLLHHVVPTLRRADSYVHTLEEEHQPEEQEEEEEKEDMVADDDEDFADLALTRTSSHSSAASPPELMDHDCDSSEDEAMPPSPPTVVLPPPFTEKQQHEAASVFFTSRPGGEELEEEEAEEAAKDAFYGEGFYLPPRNPARLVTAISVY